jgi:SPP1 gp7 family putative phage head morphogenesis protein
MAWEMMMKTRRKSKWVKPPAKDYIEGGEINPSIAVGMRYNQQLQFLINRMTDEVTRSITALFKGEVAEEYFAEDASISTQAKILTNKLMAKFNLLFSRKAGTLASQFVKQADEASDVGVRMSLKELAQGMTIPYQKPDKATQEILNATVNENVSLIKSIPMKYLSGVEQAVQRSITTGNGLQDLIPYLQKHKGVTHRRAQLIALDQNRKISSALEANKMQNLGITHFKWKHSGGSHEPRPLHIKLNNEIFSFAEPPIIDEKTGERGLPAQLVNCRCRAIPIIKFDKP